MNLWESKNIYIPVDFKQVKNTSCVTADQLDSTEKAALKGAVKKTNSSKDSAERSSITRHEPHNSDIVLNINKQ